MSPIRPTWRGERPFEIRSPPVILYRASDDKGVRGAIYKRINDLINARNRRLVSAAYELGFGSGRCYSRAVDTMIRPKVVGSVR